MSAENPTAFPSELEAQMVSRHPPGVHQKLKAGRAAIAGLGGLGSQIAVMLARSGVGTLFLVDFDIVEPSNLNRQHYTAAHLGMRKTEALRTQINAVNPYTDVIIRDVRITAENAAEIFAGWPVVAEALDDPVSKAELTAALLADGVTKIVAASGMAGYGSANSIRTYRRLENLILCGDLETDMSEGVLAPRVMICAGHQANAVVRLLLEQELM